MHCWKDKISKIYSIEPFHKVVHFILGCLYLVWYGKKLQEMSVKWNVIPFNKNVKYSFSQVAIHTENLTNAQMHLEPTEQWHVPSITITTCYTWALTGRDEYKQYGNRSLPRWIVPPASSPQASDENSFMVNSDCYDHLYSQYISKEFCGPKRQKYWKCSI